MLKKDERTVTSESNAVRIVLKHGPILMPSLQRAGVEASHALWQGITAAEFYPPNVESAYYVISLEKRLVRSDEAFIVEAELCQALKLLAKAWPFSGGSFMHFETYERVDAPLYESNANEIESKLLAQEGRRRVVASASMGALIAATYRHPPLATASCLAQAMVSDPALDKLLEYHHLARIEYQSRRRLDRSAWFVHLYKIQEGLKKFYRGAANVTSQLAISKNDWKFFGNILNNNDLRHADITGMAPAVPAQDVDRLYRLAYDWIYAHLVNQGLPGSRP
jgi:hypothetical protein